MWHLISHLCFVSRTLICQYVHGAAPGIRCFLTAIGREASFWLLNPGGQTMLSQVGWEHI